MGRREAYRRYRHHVIMWQKALNEAIDEHRGFHIVRGLGVFRYVPQIELF